MYVAKWKKIKIILYFILCELKGRYNILYEGNRCSRADGVGKTWPRFEQSAHLPLDRTPVSVDITSKALHLFSTLYKYMYLKSRMVQITSG